MEEYSEAKIYKSKPELRNSNVNADYFCQWKYSNQLLDAQNLFSIKQGNQNTVKPLLSSPLLRGQFLFGSQQPKSQKKLTAIC